MATATKWTELPVPPGFNVIREGTASVLVPDGNQVFYNEVQEFNRDLSILVISQFATNSMEERSLKAQQYFERKEKRTAGENAMNNKNETTTTTTTDDTTAEQPTKKHKSTPDKTNNNNNNDDDNKLVSLTSKTKICQDETLPPRFRYDGVRIFEALSASGLRSIRYYNEIPYVDTIHVNDMDTEAVESIRRNILYNQLPLEKVIPNRNEATAALYANRATTHELVQKLNVHKESTLPPRPDSIPDDHPLQFLYSQQHGNTTSLANDYIPKLPLWNVVDLDPYGSAAPFLDAAIQAVQDDGLLCVTCTDGAVLCGNYMETGFGKYNAIPLHSNDVSKEFGLRMLLHTIESTATKYGRTITPLLSLSIDFYVRVFVKVNTSQAAVKFSGSRHVFLGQCVGCRTTFTSKCMQSTPEYNPSLPISQQTHAKHTHGQSPLPSTCEICQSRIKVCGPIWGDEIHNPHFVKQCLQTLEHRQFRGELLEANNGIALSQDPNADVTKKPDETKLTQYQLIKKKKVPELLDLTPIPHITKKFGTYQRLKGMLTMAHSELSTVLGISVPSLAQSLSISTPKIENLLSAFINGGYKVSESHTAPNFIKTDAPTGFFIDVIRALLVMNNGSLSKPWKSCSYVPRSYVAGENVLDVEGNLIKFDTDEDEKQIVDEFNNNNDNAALIQYHKQLSIVPINTTIPSHQQPDGNIAAIKQHFLTRFAPKKPNQSQQLSCWIMSHPIRNKINFTTRQRVKIPVFFENPSAYWGPKAAAGSFDTRNYTNLSMGDGNTDGENHTANISRALALAQQQKAIANQGKHLAAKAAKANAAKEAAGIVDGGDIEEKKQ